MSNFDLKIKFDKAFDKLFFSKNFRAEMTNKIGICPKGITFDTCYDNDDSEIYFKLVSKNYGYEYSGEMVVGDYTLNKFVFTQEMADFAISYIRNNAPDLFDEIKAFEIVY